MARALMSTRSAPAFLGTNASTTRRASVPRMRAGDQSLRRRRGGYAQAISPAHAADVITVPVLVGVNMSVAANRHGHP